MSYTPPNNSSFDFNFTDETYTPPDNTAFDFYFEFVSGPSLISISSTDDFSLDDTLVVILIIPVVSTDSSEFEDSMILNRITMDYFVNECRFSDRVSSLDFILYWYCRTKIPRMGYGGTEYGNVLGYGQGASPDIVAYRLIVKNSGGDIVRDEEIAITDFENPDVIYWYDSQTNIDDNTTYQTDLTFEVYQKDSKGVYSTLETVSTF